MDREESEFFEGFWGVSFFFDEGLVALGGNEEGAVVETHFSVFEEVVDKGHDVSFGSFETFEDEDATFEGGADDGLVGVFGFTSNNFSSLF